MSKLSDDEQLVKLILIQAKIMPYWSQDDDDNMKKLLSRLERGRKAMEAMEKAKRLCDVIVNSHPDRMIRGEIESMAFELSTYLNYDNPCKEAIDENRNGEI